jgi:uncharacterized membrane protein (DUF106 family)
MRARLKSITKDRSRLNFAILVLVTVGLVLVGWASVYAQYVSLRQAGIKAMQEAELEIVQSTARAAQVYVDQQINMLGRSVDELRTIEEEIFLKFVAPIELLVPEGDAWIIGADKRMVFDQSVDFPYWDLTLAEFLDVQAECCGASDYDKMRDDVMGDREGVGSYIWLPEKGLEIGAWTPAEVIVDGEVYTKWVIGLTTPLPAIMDATGANASILNSILVNIAVTLVVAGVLLSFRAGQRRVQELEQRVAELQIEIDEAKRDRDVKLIVESEYFQDLRAQAKELRARSRDRREEEGK